MRWRGFTLMELVATMLVLGLAAALGAPLMLEFSRAAATQQDVRRELWETNHAMERIAELVRTAPDGAPEGSGIVEVSARHFTRHDGLGARFENGSVYVFDDEGESLLAANIAESIELSVVGRDGVTDASDAPLDAWSAQLGIDLGAGTVRTAVSLARPAPEEEGESALEIAFAFGQNDWTRPVPGDPEQDYIKIVQYGDNFLYDPARGYGYTDVDGIDDSPNNRGRYSGDNEIYDQFIGCKYAVGNTIVFRMDVPNGQYRFVLAGGDGSYEHTSRITVRDGSDAATEQVLVGNIAHRTGEFFRVGFPGRAAPSTDGPGKKPKFIADIQSPTLTVTHGYIEMHQIDAGTNGGCVCLVELWRAGDVNEGTIDFAGYSILSFGGDQDGQHGRETSYEILEGGAALRLFGNAWKAIEFPYTVTENTVIEFEYASPSEGEIPGIQTSIDMEIDAKRALQVWGEQNWARIKHPHIDEYTGSGEYETFRIKLHEESPAYPLGDIVYLVFIHDDDSGPYTESFFRNVRVYEDDE